MLPVLVWSCLTDNPAAFTSKLFTVPARFGCCMGDDEIDLLVSQVDAAASIEELYWNVLFVNEWLDQQQGLRLADAGAEDGGRLFGKLKRWLSHFRERLDALASSQGAESYSVSISGGMTGPSISLDVTYAPDRT